MFESIKQIFSRAKRALIREKIEGKPIALEDLLVPKRFRGIFSVLQGMEKENELVVTLVENEECMPKEAKELQEKGIKIVKNGYFNTVEVLAGNRFLYPLYIKFKRRRWKNTKTGEEYSNQYEFHPEGLKVLHEFAEHLKKISRRKFNKLFCDWDSVRYLRKEDFSLVQGKS